MEPEQLELLTIPTTTKDSFCDWEIDQEDGKEEELWEKYQKRKKASHSSIYVPELVQDSPSQELESEDLTSPDCVKTKNTVGTSSVNGSQEYQSTVMLEAFLDSQEPTSSQQVHPVHHSQCKGNAEEQQTSEIASLTYWKRSLAISQIFSPLKTSLDSLAVPLDLENQTYISIASSDSLPQSGIAVSGFVLVQDTLARPSLEKDYCWLESPGALSSGKSKPPGQSRLEARLKQENVLVKGECLNPNWLEHWLNVPQNWTNPSELRTAAELIEADDKHWVMRLIHKSGKLRSEESNISIPCVIKKPGTLTVDGVIVGDCGDKFRVKVGDRLTTVPKLYVYPNLNSPSKKCRTSAITPSKKQDICSSEAITPSKKCRTFPITPSKNENTCPTNQQTQPLITKKLVTDDWSLITEKITPSKKQCKRSNADPITPSKKRRRKGEGTGQLFSKPLVKNSKTYNQWWYQWKTNGKKRTKYVGKKVLGLVQELEEQKAPVIEILKVLGVEQC